MPNVMRDPLPLAATAFVALFWAGALAGVSFLATPVKFQAMSLTLPVALEVGRVTFALFTRFEWGLALLLAMAVFLPIRHAQKYQGACAAAVILLVLVEALWLLPALDARVDAVIGGIPLRPSPHHGFYTVAEGTKLVLLGTIAALSLFELGWRTATPSRSLIMTRELQVP